MAADTAETADCSSEELGMISGDFCEVGFSCFVLVGVVLALTGVVLVFDEVVEISFECFVVCSGDVLS